MNTFFTSDTHFFHDNIIKFCRYKDFQLTDEMNEKLVENWNSVVKPEDKIFHLGDVTFKLNDKFTELFKRLNGTKYLFVGNHDDINSERLIKKFVWVKLWSGNIFKEYNFVCSHIPLREDQMRNAEFNVHGHLHEKVLDSPRHINVCVEQTNYTPVHLDELISKCKV